MLPLDLPTTTGWPSVGRTSAAKPMLRRLAATCSAAVRHCSLYAGSVETEAMRNSANRRSTLWSISWSMRAKTASSVLMSCSRGQAGKLAMLSQAEKRRRLVQMFEFAVRLQVETADLGKSDVVFPFSFQDF